MNRATKRRRRRILFPLILLPAIIAGQVRAQTPTPQNPVEPARTQTQTQPNQPGQLPDFAELNLSAEQIQKIRAINAEVKDQRQAAGIKLRQAQRALAEAIESPTPNEALIEQRSHELADAQATTIRLRSLTEARILQVMTPEQRIRVREIRQRNQALRRSGNQQLPVNGLGRRRDGSPRNPNAVAPLGPRQRKLMRQQQKR